MAAVTTSRTANHSTAAADSPKRLAPGSTAPTSAAYNRLSEAEVVVVKSCTVLRRSKMTSMRRIRNRTFLAKPRKNGNRCSSTGRCIAQVMKRMRRHAFARSVRKNTEKATSQGRNVADHCSRRTHENPLVVGESECVTRHELDWC
jgi:tRNA A37 methylthiotransferase MiaB